MTLFGDSKPLGLFQDLVKVAAADGTVSVAEAAILKAMGMKLGLSEKDIQKVLSKPNKVKYKVPKDEHGKLQHLLMCVEVMLVDGRIDARERDLCMKIAAKMDLPPSLVDRMLRDFLAHRAQVVQRRITRQVRVQRQPAVGPDLVAEIDAFLRSRR